MRDQLAKIRTEALAAFESAADLTALDALRVQYLGKKGELTGVLKMMGKLSAEERPAMGQLANEVRAALEEALEAASKKLAEAAMEQRLVAEAVDVTIPGTAVEIGHKHPMYTALDGFKEIFINMGFEIIEGPEIEESDYNFTKLTTPMLNEFVDRILVHEAVKLDGERVQEVEVYLNYIGKFELPEPELTAKEQEALEKDRARRAKQREYCKAYRERKRKEKAEQTATPDDAA